MAVVADKDISQSKWLETKLAAYKIKPVFDEIGNENSKETKKEKVAEEGRVAPPPDGPLFKNPFKIEDLMVFDDMTLREMLNNGSFGLNVKEVAQSVQGAEEELVDRIQRNLPYQRRFEFKKELRHNLPENEIKATCQRVLDNLFWELTYWKTPELYEELTEGEQLHPGIFRRLGPDLRGKTVLDAGAGSGRASFECLRQGAKQVYAVEPSPGLLRILEEKLENQPAAKKIVPLRGRFDNIPLEDNSVDMAISCSAFTAEPEQGGEPGLQELKRVTKPGGKMVIIWPRTEDYDWLAKQSFQYVAMPMQHEMRVHFRSLQSAWRCARRFYGKNQALMQYLVRRRQPEVPFSVLGFNPPHDYCWLEVKK